uniref:Putative HNH homing endonuclease n=1 Tax=Microglena monadina TaxID=47904 RepID=A0A0S2IBQ6_9CHLO|nr:putative HNH homing endonuclease [Microglena monadina]
MNKENKNINNNRNDIFNWRNLDRNNKYFKFIEECRIKNYDPKTDGINTHHIIPQYVFNSEEDQNYKESLENLIRLSVKDHIQAHKLLYEVYKNEQDNGAINLLSGATEEARLIYRRLGAKATNEDQRKKGATFFNREYQRELALRSMNRPDAIEIRSKAGQIGGTNRQKN